MTYLQGLLKTFLKNKINFCLRELTWESTKVLEILSITLKIWINVFSLEQILKSGPTPSLERESEAAIFINLNGGIEMAVKPNKPEAVALKRQSSKEFVYKKWLQLALIGQPD